MATNKFPFIGAGFGRYFEFCNLSIKFGQKPLKKQQQAIIKIAPKPLGEIGSDNFTGSILAICSDQFVNMYIELEYGDSDPENMEEDPGYYCSNEAAAAFEEDLVRWLNEVHAICPIEIVYRPEDGEADGTELSEWHTESLRQIPGLVEKWQSEKYDDEEREYFIGILEGVLQYGENTDSAAIIKSIFEDYSPEDEGMENSDVDIMERVIVAIINNDYDTLNEIAQHAFTQGVLQQTAYSIYLKTANEIHAQQQWELTIRLYEYVLYLLSESPISDLSLYCNALWILQDNNTQVGVNVEMNEKFLAACLPHAEQEPTIYINAACLYVEMELFDKALECLDKYFSSEADSDEKERMLQQAKVGNVFSKFRQYNGVEGMIEKWHNGDALLSRNE